MSREPEGWVAEMFASIQGEGSWVGRRQIFLRLAGCRQRCAYCDTAWARRVRPPAWRVKAPDRPEAPEAAENPVRPETLAARITEWCRRYGPFHSLALTGGEPLEQAPFIAALARRLRRLRPGLRLMLETNGLEAAAVAGLRGRLHFIAADIKLPSAARGPARWARHGRFLAAARWAEGCVKAVITPQTPVAEVRTAARLAWKHAPKWEFILQPVTASRRGAPAPAPWLRAALAVHPNVRLIPQIHPSLGID